MQLVSKYHNGYLVVTSKFIMYFHAKQNMPNQPPLVNIDANDIDKFNSDDVWAPHIVIRDWVFKPKPDNAMSSNE